MAGLKNSAKMPINLNAFSGGESVDYKNGVQNSFYDSVALDFRKKSSQMSVLPGMTATTAGLEDLIVAMTQDPTGVRWAVGDTGKIYKVALDGTITKVATMTSASGHGIVYNQLSDMLYITGQQTVSMYGPLTSTLTSPTFYSDQFAQSASVANGVVNLYNPTDGTYDGSSRNGAQNIGLTQGITAASQVSATNATNSYVLPTAISEATGQFCVFAPDLEPFYSIPVRVKVVGTGNWTLTLHNGLNQVVASVTVPNATVAAAGVGNYVEFKFPAPGVRSFTGAVQSGLSAAYHFHLTSSVSSDTAAVAVVTASDLTGCDFLLFNQRLVQTNNTWHPAALFTGTQMMLCIGNGQYLSTYSFGNDQKPSNNMWQRERFPLDAGYEACGLTVNNQYLVIAAEKRSSSTVNNFQDGMLYFWDGINATYNFKIEVPMGAPYSIYTYNNITYFVCAGSLFAWGGGQQVIKVRPIAYQNTDYLGVSDNTIVNPNMMDSRYNLLMIGYPSYTTNINTRYGIYSWGSVELIYPNSFGLSYLLSNRQLTSTATNNLRIGMVKNFVDTMYMSWKYVDGGGVTRYGLDITNNMSLPAPNFSWESLIWDGGARYKLKQALRYKINFEALPAGSTITAKISVDRQAWKVYSTYTVTAGATELFIDISDLRFHELQWGFDGTCNGTTTTPPTITGVVTEIDPLGDEVDITADDVVYG